MKKRMSFLTNNRKIIENFSFLSLFQILTLVSPLITYPYLIKTIGLELYGTTVFAQTLVSYLSLLINFGYNTSGPKEVSVLKDDNKRLSEFVSSVFIVKAILWFLVGLVFILFIYWNKYFNRFFLLYFFTFFITIGDVLFPIWFFQGIEKMKYITYINVIVKLIFVTCIFILIKDKNDYILIPIINAVGSLVSGIISLYLVFKKENISFVRVKYANIKSSVHESFVLFISSLSVSLYLSINKLIVGAFLGMREVAIYDLAEKVIGIIKTPIIILSQAVFPKIAREKSIVFINKILKITLLGVVFLYVFLFLFSDKIVYFFIHEQNHTAVNIIRIYGISMFFLALNIFLGGLRLVPFGHNKNYMWIMLANGITYIILVSILYFLNIISLYTVTIAYVLVEVFCSLYLLIINKKLNLLY